jgi:hypothetical protein
VQLTPALLLLAPYAGGDVFPGLNATDLCLLWRYIAPAAVCRALENDMAPILVVATNRGITRIRGTNYR